MKSTSFRFSSLFFFFIVAGYSNVALAADEQCTYDIIVQTGTVSGAGTNSRISMMLSDVKGKTISIPNLAHVGVNGPSYDYFEEGQHDKFKIREGCITVCRMSVQSDDSGFRSGWKLDYVEVATTGSNVPPGTRVSFEVDQWLATDEPPYSLSALVNRCNYAAQARGEGLSANRTKVHADKRSGPAFDIIRQAWAE